MRADQQTTSEVLDTLSRFSDAFSKRDMGGLMSTLAPEPDVTFIGTGADEERAGTSEIQAQIQRDWDQSESASIELGQLAVSSHGPVAWVAGGVALRATAGGKDISLPGRLTAVMEKRDGHWLIAQWHLSVPMSEQEQGRSFPS